MPVSGIARKYDHKKKFIPVLSLALLVALSLMGISFAFLSDTLTLEPTVKSGELKADVSIVGVAPGWNFDPGTNTLALNAAGADLGATYSVTYRVVNSGSVPLKVHAALTAPDIDGIVTTLEPAGWPVLNTTETGDYTITVTLPNDPAVFRYNPDSYSFAAKIEIQQWNTP